LTSPWIETARELNPVAVTLASPRTPVTLPLLQSDFANKDFLQFGYNEYLAVRGDLQGRSI